LLVVRVVDFVAPTRRSRRRRSGSHGDL
jgi:hypothetical protein